VKVAISDEAQTNQIYLWMFCFKWRLPSWMKLRPIRSVLVKVAILDEAQTNQIYLRMFCFSEGSHPAWSTDHSDIFQNRITQRLFLPNAILFYFIVIAHFKVGTCTAGFKFEKHITLHKTIKKKDSELFWPFEADKSK
jgi:hypothetical protein